MLEPSVKSVESNHSISYKIERLLCAIKDFLCAKGKLIGYLSTVALACYGFELFNLHLTIDEEVHAYASRSEEWIQQGRWGMYLLSRFLFPQPVIPFAPLFVALTSHLLAVVVLLHAWGIKDKFATMSAGTIFMGFPGFQQHKLWNWCWVPVNCISGTGICESFRGITITRRISCNICNCHLSRYGCRTGRGFCRANNCRDPAVGESPY